MDEGTRAAERLLVSVNSRKGGVGKSTLALAVALAGMEGTPGPDDSTPVPAVVLLDADIYGSEVSDALLDSGSTPEGEWILSVEDVLTQSTGGNATMAQWIETKLRSVDERCRQHLKAEKPGRPDDTARRRSSGLPVLPFQLSNGQRRLMVIPSTRWKDPVERLRNRPGLDSPVHSFLAETMGRVQVELRLTALITSIMKVFHPVLIVVDNAPFHLPLANVWEKWADRKKWRDLMLYGDCAGEWERYRVVSVEVAGPERQDLLPFLGDLIDDGQRRERHGRGWRWVLNKDVHLPGEGIDACNTRKLMQNLMPQVPELGHVLLAPGLFLGVHAESISRMSLGDADGGKAPFFAGGGGLRSFRKLVTKAYEAGELSPRVWSPDANKYLVKEWWDFLVGT